MRQVIEDPKTGTIRVPDVPAPSCGRGMVLVQTGASLISAATEAAAIKFGKQNLLQKARSRPDLVKQVVRKVRSEGLRATYQTVQSRLEFPIPLGYSSAGQVLQAGSMVPNIQPGARVACAGQGYASHAELAAVPVNLTARIPEGVSDEEAAFCTVGAIALQGVRIADIRIGERVVVIGLGLIGLLTVQLLKAAGCQVLGTDLNPSRIALAEELGADQAHPLQFESLVEAVAAFTDGRGADAVIITAATKSNQPVELAGELSRLRGRVVAVGDVAMDIPRRTYYEKELDFRLSRSYGPGRYDPQYEEKGIDYPYAYVPFTEQRNMEAFLQLVAEKKVTPQRLITHRFPLEEAERAYSVIKGETSEPFLGVIFTYPTALDERRTVAVTTAAPVKTASEKTVRIGLIGAGNYARLMLLPTLKTLKSVELVNVSTSRGISAWDAANRFGFENGTTDTKQLLSDSGINTVVIATRHDSHASLTTAALAAGKHVFVEKPLATNETELRAVLNAAEGAGRQLMVGFNRRFAPLVKTARERFQNHTQPLAMIYRINAGAVPSEHWTQDAEEGGGRIIGEVCHFVDALQYLCGAPPVSVFASTVSGSTGAQPAEDILTVTLQFADGSVGTIHYFANGDKAIPKEYLEVYGGGRTFILDDFRSARYAEGGKVQTFRAKAQDKGQAGQLEAFAQAILDGGSPLIPLSELTLTTLCTFRILDSLREGRPVPVDWEANLRETEPTPHSNCGKT